MPAFGIKSITHFLGKYGKYHVLAALVYMPIFGNLDILAIRDYDEGRIAANAAEMHQTGDLIVTRFEGRPEMWNTKPPLLIWCQVLLMKIVGVNEIAIRLPSSLSAFFTCMVLLLFCKRYLKNEWLGILAVLVLITTDGYVHFHISRTGDYDCMLSLFTFLGCVFFFLYCETSQPGFLYFFFLALGLGVLTKGIAGLLFIPAFFLFALFDKRLLPMLSSKHFYFGFLIFLFLGFGYYVVRETQNPGYLAQVAENELGGRYLVSQGHQAQDYFFYFRKIINQQMTDRYFLIPCGMLLGLFSRDPRIRRFSVFLSLCSVLFFLIISFGKTRMEQYVAPLFPMFFFMIALALWQLLVAIRNLLPEKINPARQMVPFILTFLLLIIPYQKIWSKTYTPQEAAWWDSEFYELCYFYKDVLRHKEPNLNGTLMLYSGYNAHMLFYLYALNAKGIKTGYTIPEKIKPGDRLVVYQDDMKKLIHDNYKYKEEELRGRVYLITILPG